MAADIEFEIKPPGKFSFNAGELWQYRELIYFFTLRDIKIKYKQTFFGVLWAILQPFLLMVLFTLFFGKGLHVPSDNIPYPVFVYSGLLLWNIFSSGLTNASNSMVNNSNIIKKIYFPRLIIPLSAVLVSFFDFLMALIIYFGILIYYHHPVNWDIILYLPLSVIITVLSTFGLGSFVAALNVKYRDFRYVIPFFIQALLFLTPVIYPVSIIKYKWLQTILSLNPLAGAIDLLHSTVTNSQVNWSLVTASIIISILIVLTGLFYFRKTEYYFADFA